MNTFVTTSTFESIHYALLNDLEGKEENHNASLFNGLSGLALYYLFLGEHFKPVYTNKGKEILSKIIDRVQNVSFNLSNPYSLCNGLTGVLYTLNYAEKKGYIDQGMTEQLAVFKPILLKFAKKDYARKNTDFLHGPLGLFWHLLQANPIVNQPELLQLLEAYEQQGINDSLGFRIVNTANPDQTDTTYNLSFSHGLMGQLMLMAAAYEQGFEQKRIQIIIEKGVQYLFSIKALEKGTWGSHFPCSTFEESGKPKHLQFANRVAWCYGDIGTALLFLKLGKLFSNEEWHNLGVKIALDTTKSTTLEEAKIKDPYICHGTSGAAYIYHKIYQSTGIYAFKEASWHWLSLTVDNTQSLEYNTAPNQKLSILEGDLGLALTVFCLQNDLTFDFDDILLLF